MMLKKLGSRKLWAAVAAAALGVFAEELGVANIELVKWAIGALVGYIIGEAVVDVARAGRGVAR